MPLTPCTRPAPAARAIVAAIGLAAVGLMCAACGPDLADPPGTGSPIVRDSAGIRIVENGPVAAWTDETRWRMSEEPIVRIGAREGPPHLTFGFALGARRLSDGRIVVADRHTSQIHYYDTTGEHLMTVGGSGQGPASSPRSGASTGSRTIP